MGNTGVTIVEKPVVGVKIKLIGNVKVVTWWGGNELIHYPPILLIHGMFIAGWCFDSWAKFLCDNGYIVYVIKDLKEHEDIRKVDFYTYLEKSTKVAEAICASTGDKIILLGHSMGGLIAQKIAETKPDLVAGLVLVASAPPKGISIVSWSVVKAMAKHWFSLIFNLPLKIDKKSAFNLLFNWLGGEAKKEQLFEKLVPESSMIAKQLAISSIPIDEKRVVCKVMVFAGLNDKLLPNRIQASIADKYDRSYYISMLTGHMPMLDSSEEIIKDIYHWISSVLCE